MNREGTPQLVPVDRKMLFALSAIAWFALCATAGVVSSLAQRAGVHAPLANGITFGIAATLMYPYFVIRSSMFEGGNPRLPSSFGKFALHWLASSVIIHLLVARLLDVVWP
jgi:hypothetical protein